LLADFFAAGFLLADFLLVDVLAADFFAADFFAADFFAAGFFAADFFAAGFLVAVFLLPVFFAPDFFLMAITLRCRRARFVSHDAVPWTTSKGAMRFLWVSLLSLSAGCSFGLDEFTAPIDDAADAEESSASDVNPATDSASSIDGAPAVDATPVDDAEVCTGPKPDRCNGVCTDVSRDPQNCGKCGKSCKTGESCNHSCQRGMGGG
jgi:hypothetical protein